MDLNVLFAPQVEKLKQIYLELGHEPNRLQIALQSVIDNEVERSVDEVNQIKQRIELLTRQCKAYSSVLDDSKGASDAASSSLSSMTLIQKRTELQANVDRLQSMYASRRIQAEKLVARIDEYRPILGDQAPIVKLEVPKADSTHVPSLPRPSELHAILSSCAEEVRRRNTQIEESLNSIVQLWSELWQMPNLEDEFDAMVLHHLGLQPVLSECGGNEAEFAGVFERAIASHDDGIESTPTRKSGTERELGTQVSRVQGSQAMAPTSENLSKAASRVDLLTTEKERRFEKIQCLFDELSLLWKKFDVADEAIDEFVQENTGCNMAVIQAYERELKQMKELKAEHMTLFISKVREDVAGLWDQLLMTEVERREDLPEFFQDLVDGEETGAEPSDELLAIHEGKVQELKKELEAKARPLELVRQYKRLLAEAQELEASAKDTTRLTGRGTGQKRDPGRLLREEKTRKRIKVTKPKIEEELLRTIPAWEEETNRAFCIDGQRFLDTFEIQATSPRKRARIVSGNGGSVAATPQTVPKKSRIYSGQNGVNGSVQRVISTPHQLATTPAVQSQTAQRNTQIPRFRVPKSAAGKQFSDLRNVGLGALKDLDTNRVTSHSSVGSAATDRTMIVHQPTKIKRRAPSLLVEESLRSSGMTRNDFTKPTTTGAGTSARPVSHSISNEKTSAYNESVTLGGANWAVLDEDDESNLLS